MTTCPGEQRRACTATSEFRDTIDDPSEDALVMMFKDIEAGHGTYLIEPLACGIRAIKRRLGSEAAKRSRLARLIVRGQAMRAELDRRDLYADA